MWRLYISHKGSELVEREREREGGERGGREREREREMSLNLNRLKDTEASVHDPGSRLGFNQQLRQSM